jgi:acylphosphatase
VADSSLHLVVKGRVQGVGFRWYVADMARRLNLAGWVKNREDGAVELCASGNDKSLASLETAVRKGPAGAHIAAIEEVEGNPPDALTKPFSIAREG